MVVLFETHRGMYTHCHIATTGTARNNVDDLNISIVSNSNF